MEAPTLHSKLRDDEADLTYVVMAYRELTRAEIAGAIRQNQASRRKPPRAGSIVRILNRGKPRATPLPIEPNTNRVVEAAPRAFPPKSIFAFAYVTAGLGIENSARRRLTHAGEISRGTQRER